MEAPLETPHLAVAALEERRGALDRRVRLADRGLDTRRCVHLQRSIAALGGDDQLVARGVVSLLGVQQRRVRIHAGIARVQHVGAQEREGAEPLDQGPADSDAAVSIDLLVAIEEEHRLVADPIVAASGQQAGEPEGEQEREGRETETDTARHAGEPYASVSGTQSQVPPQTGEPSFCSRGLVWCARMHRLVPLLVLTVVACASSTPEEEHRSGDTLFTTGDEREVPEPISSGPAPLPLPMPPVPRGAMTVPTQETWTATEELMAMTPPNAPEGSDGAEFTEWLQRRVEGISALVRRLERLGSAPLYERAIGGALLGTAMEDTVADARGAPVSTDITSDPELLAAYRQALDQVLLPFAQQAATGYQLCAAMLDELGDASWGEWRAFCFERAEDIAATYRDAAAAADAAEAADGEPE